MRVCKHWGRGCSAALGRALGPGLNDAPGCLRAHRGCGAGPTRRGRHLGPRAWASVGRGPSAQRQPGLEAIQPPTRGGGATPGLPQLSEGGAVCVWGAGAAPATAAQYSHYCTPARLAAAPGPQRDTPYPTTCGGKALPRPC